MVFSFKQLTKKTNSIALNKNLATNHKNNNKK